EKRGLENGQWATIVSPRGVIEAQVLVTDRMQMMKINGEEFHQIGLPYHYGESDSTAVAGDGANDLLGLTLEPNVFIQNSKIGACDIQPGRRPRGEARVEMLKEYQKRAHLNLDSGNDLLTVDDSFTYNPEPQQPVDADTPGEKGEESEEGK
ncbi:MAG: formate dehydrogenase, partial [Corynebacterium sp.]|nr:formate dehydrogenase [Corynebacterium sp.]